MRPALLLLADLDREITGPVVGPPAGDSLLDTALARARSVGGVGRVLLFHPVEAEATLTARALGFRLWPSDGTTAGARWANAFRQAEALGYEGAVVVEVGAAARLGARLDEVVERLAGHPVVVLPDDAGAIAVLALQRHEPSLVPAADEVPDVDTLQRRARQLRVPVLALDPLIPGGSAGGRVDGDVDARA